MQRASPHSSQHHSKAVSPPARRGPAWQKAMVTLVLAIFGASAGFGAHGFPRHQSSKTASAKPNRALAEKDVQVGRFYFNIGKYEASISRFQSAVAHDARWAVPHELLGEAFEKKNDPKRALAEYREYLKMAPHANDARKIQQRVEKLTRDVKDESAAGS